MLQGRDRVGDRLFAAALALYARQGRPAAVPVMAASGAAVLAGALQTDTVSRVCALAGLVLVPAGTAVLEQVLGRAPRALPDGGPPHEAGTGSMTARRDNLASIVAEN